MPQPNSTKSTPNEGRILLAISAIERDQFPSVRRAAAAYNVPESTLRDRRARKTLRRDSEANSKKLTKLEESVIIRHILDLDLRGFSPKLSAVRDMANHLLSERAVGQVGINWPSNLV